MTKIKNLPAVIVLSCLVLLLSTGHPFAADAPKPGTVIDKSNYMQYKDFFPEEWLEAFTTGWDLLPPLAITVRETKPNPTPKAFLEASEKNRGKYSIDAEGYISGGPDAEIVGYPFPDIKPGDPQFAEKYMWNYDYKYGMDDCYSNFINYQKRRGEPVTTSAVESWQLVYQSRMFDDPKPHYNTSSGWRYVNMLRVLTPPATRNMIYSLIRYKDQKEPDLTYVYLPTMRRVLRGEAGQRSTPIASSTQAPDDFSGGFSGRIPEFTCKFIGEKKVIAQAHAQIDYTAVKDKTFDFIPVEMDNWEVRDVYVFDIFPKDPKYPQGRKRVWIDKENLFSLYAAAYDRAGGFWKMWQTAGSQEPSHGSGGGTLPYMKGMLGIDTQLGYAVQMVTDWRFNGNSITESDVNVAAMRRVAR